VSWSNIISINKKYLKDMTIVSITFFCIYLL